MKTLIPLKQRSSKIMNSFPEDLLAIILSRLPIKSFTTCKLVCKQWNLIMESPYFRDLFLSFHQNSHSSSWSFVFFNFETEYVAYYGCDTWGLQRSLGSYISSFLTKKFETKKDKYKVQAHTDVGLVLISEQDRNKLFYVANPISQLCVDIPSHAHLKKFAWRMGIATHTKKGVLSGYKVVLFDKFPTKTSLSLLIYSSETGFWSLKTVHLPFSSSGMQFTSSISLNGNLHWLDYHVQDVIVSYDFLATGMGSDQCRVTPFPDVEKRSRFERYCTTCQGFLMYMNIISVTKVDGSLEDKLCVWRLKSWEWQLVSEISPDFIDTGFEYYPLGINPFDAKTVYLWSTQHQILVSVNLRDGKFVLHGKLEHSRDGHTLSSDECWKTKTYVESNYRLCVLPQWLHQIPVRRVS